MLARIRVNVCIRASKLRHTKQNLQKNKNIKNALFSVFFMVKIRKFALTHDSLAIPSIRLVCHDKVQFSQNFEEPKPNSRLMEALGEEKIIASLQVGSKSNEQKKIMTQIVSP